MNALMAAFEARTEPELIASGARFRFHEYDGEVSLLNGVAVGTSWYLFKFHGGEFDGQSLWMTGYPDEGFTYLANAQEDGYLFNWNGRQLQTGREHDANNLDIPEGGAYLPEWNNHTFNLED